MSPDAETGDVHIREETTMNVMLAILYAPEGQKPLSIARIYDRVLLSAAERFTPSSILPPSVAVPFLSIRPATAAL